MCLAQNQSINAPPAGEFPPKNMANKRDAEWWVADGHLLMDRLLLLSNNRRDRLQPLPAIIESINGCISAVHSCAAGELLLQTDSPGTGCEPVSGKYSTNNPSNAQNPSLTPGVLMFLQVQEVLPRWWLPQQQAR